MILLNINEKTFLTAEEGTKPDNAMEFIYLYFINFI